MTLRKTDWFAVYGQLLKRHKGTTFLLLHYFIFCYCCCCSLLLVFLLLFEFFFCSVFLFLEEFFLSLQTSPTTDINVLNRSGGFREGARRARSPLPPLFLDQTEAQRAEKKKLTPPPPPFSQGLDDRAPPYLIRNLMV